MDIRTIGIIGAGLLVSGIAQICAANGLQVVMRDINDAAVQRGIGSIAANLDRALGKDKITAEQKDATLAAMSAVSAMPSSIIAARGTSARSSRPKSLA